MAIRKATLNDVPAIVDMGVQFHAYSPFKDIPFDPEATARFVAGCIETGAVFLSEHGMCGGVVAPFYFNPRFTQATEFFWWSPVKGEGRELREAFEAWAKEAGASAVQFGALADGKYEDVARNYTAAGFKPMETTFLKRFQ
jgi:hypothetical protein